MQRAADASDILPSLCTHCLVLIRFLDKALYEKETRYVHFKLIFKESTLFIHWPLPRLNMGIYSTTRHLIKIPRRLKFSAFLCKD